MARALQPIFDYQRELGAAAPSGNVMSSIDKWMQLLWRAFEVLHEEGVPLVEARDEIANLVFYRWVDEEAERDPLFGKNVFPMQATRYRWRSAMELGARDFARFLHEDVYSYLGSLDRAAPDVAFFFRFFDRPGRSRRLFAVAQLIDRQDLHSLTAEQASAFVDGLLGPERSKQSDPLGRTPAPVRALLVDLLRPVLEDRVLDLASGSGGLLHDIARRRQGRPGRASVGVEINSTSMKYAHLRFLLSGFLLPDFWLGDAVAAAADAGVLREGEQFDVVVCDPPIGSKERAGLVRTFETPTNRLELMFLQQAMSCLAPGGRCAILLPPMVLFGGSPERQLREALFERFRVDAVFLLPGGAVAGSSIQVVAILFHRPGPDESDGGPIFFQWANADDGLTEFCTRAARSWAAKSPASSTTRMVELNELREVHYNVLRLRHQRAAVPAVSLGELVQRAQVEARRARNQFVHAEGIEPLRAPLVRLGELLTRTRGTHFESSEAWLLGLGQIEAGTGRVLEKKRVDTSAGRASTLVPFEPGNLLYSRLNPHLGKCLIADERGYAVSDLIPFGVNELRADARYVGWALRSPSFNARVRAAASGVTLQRISPESLLEMCIPLPPIEEQRRIVTQLDALSDGVNDAVALARTMGELRTAALGRLFAEENDA